MTPPKMLALITAIVCFIISTVLSLVIDYWDRKQCYHFCFWCKHKKYCDWTNRNKIPRH